MEAKINLQEVELLATILQRAGVTQIEAIWLNDLVNRLRMVAAQQVENLPKNPPGKK